MRKQYDVAASHRCRKTGSNVSNFLREASNVAHIRSQYKFIA